MSSPPGTIAPPTVGRPGNGGSVDGAAKPSFAQILGKILVDEAAETQVEGTRFRKDGAPAIGITATDEVRGEAFMEKHVIVLKFSSYRPTLEDIRDSIHRTWGILGDFSLGLLNQRHVLVRLQSEEEAKKVLSRDSLLIRGVRFKAFRWHDGFSLKEDPISVPLWVELPNLPLHLFHPPLLRAIVNSFGGFLRMDDHTRCLSRPGFARVCVEMTLAEKLPNRVWIDRTNNRGFWQKIEYPGFKYCNFCSLIGHQEEFCRKKQGLKSSGTAPDMDKAEKEAKPKVETKTIKQQYVPATKNNNLSNSEVGTSGVKNSQGEEIIEEAGFTRPVASDPIKVALSNKFESLTENIDEDGCNQADEQLVGEEMAHDNAKVMPASTEECLLEAGYSISDIENVIGKQEQTLHQEVDVVSGAQCNQVETSLGAATDANGDTVGNPSTVLEMAPNMDPFKAQTMVSVLSQVTGAGIVTSLAQEQLSEVPVMRAQPEDIGNISGPVAVSVGVLPDNKLVWEGRALRKKKKIMNINALESATEDSDVAASDSEIRSESSNIKDLELGAQSEEDLKKQVKLAAPPGNRRKTKKGVSFLPRLR